MSIDKQTEMLSDYIKSQGLTTYNPFTIENVECVGHMVLFNERDSSRYYSEHHRVNLFDILCWLYSKQ